MLILVLMGPTGSGPLVGLEDTRLLLCRVFASEPHEQSRAATRAIQLVPPARSQAAPGGWTRLLTLAPSRPGSAVAAVARMDLGHPATGRGLPL